jgi:hypothetical protein
MGTERKGSPAARRPRWRVGSTTTRKAARGCDLRRAARAAAHGRRGVPPSPLRVGAPTSLTLNRSARQVVPNISRIQARHRYRPAKTPHGRAPVQGPFCAPDRGQRPAHPLPPWPGGGMGAWSEVSWGRTTGSRRACPAWGSPRPAPGRRAGRVHHHVQVRQAVVLLRLPPQYGSIHGRQTGSRTSRMPSWLTAGTGGVGRSPRAMWDAERIRTNEAVPRLVIAAGPLSSCFLRRSNPVEVVRSKCAQPPAPTLVATRVLLTGLFSGTCGLPLPGAITPSSGTACSAPSSSQA